MLDGDNVRHGLCKDLGFTEEDRTENVRRIGETAKILKEAGFIVLCSFISPLREQREMANEIIGDDFYEVYVDCSIEECIKRDVKGLYQKAIDGEIENFTGISASYEHPPTPDLYINSERLEPEQCIETTTKRIKSLVKI